MAVSLGFLLYLARGPVPIPAMSFQAAPVRLPQPAVEPDRRIERGLLPDQDVRQFFMEDFDVLVAAEIAAFLAPISNRVGDAANKLLHAALAFQRT